MRSRTLLAAFAIVALSLIVYRQSRVALHAAVPSDMPREARFVQTGYDASSNEPLGQWIACQTSSQQPGDWCRVTDQNGSVVFEGLFLPIDSAAPVPQEHLVIGRIDRNRLWTSGPAEQSPVPVIPLTDGQTLVPVADRLLLIARWSQASGEPERFAQARN